MKVNDPNVTGSSAGQVGGAGLDRTRQTELGRRGGSARDPSLTDSPDRVALSQMSARIRSLGIDSPERVARLEKLSADVSSSRYQPNAESISRNLVEEALRKD